MAKYKSKKDGSIIEASQFLPLVSVPIGLFNVYSFGGVGVPTRYTGEVWIDDENKIAIQEGDWVITIDSDSGYYRTLSNLIFLENYTLYNTSSSMRKVAYNNWIKPEYELQGRRKIEGTGCWETKFKHIGLFHQWASAYEEFELGAGNYTVALIENPDGTISEVLPSNLKFLSE